MTLTCIGCGGHSRALELPEDTVYVQATPEDILVGKVEVEGAVVLGIGYVKRGGWQTRQKLANALKERGGVSFPSYAVEDIYQHNAYGTFTVRGCFNHDDMGRQVLCGVHVGPEVTLGAWTILNTRCIVEHDCTIGEHTHICPGAIVLGGATVGVKCMIGAGAIVLPGVKIADETIVGAGAVVVKDIEETGGMWVGTPARKVGETAGDIAEMWSHG
jgi:acetyltransferase-like isoleucine patch superfamily enzyme